MQKIRYELDPYNRFIISGTGEKSGLNRFRKVVDGRFKTDANNELSYHIKSPYHSSLLGPDETPLLKGPNLPNQLRLKGKWSLTDDHELRLTLDKESRQTFGDQITLQGEILDVKKGSLLFAVTTMTKENVRSTYVLELEGTWQADKYNRLFLSVRKEDGSCDILTLKSAWQINKAHQLVYEYEKARLIRKKRHAHTLTFKGYWDIKDALRISYLLSGSTDSAFDFKTGIGIFKEDYIKYELGIGLDKNAEPIKKIITLYGKWSLKKDVGLTFEIKYEDGKVKQIVFEGEAELFNKDTVSFKIKNGAENKDLSVELKISRKLLKPGGEAFLRAMTSRRESAIYAGAAWRW